MAPSKPNTQPENTCQYCLYFKTPPGSRQGTRGNCALHQEWIDSATRTTCSEMSNRPLEKGIYQLCEQGHGEWVYMRREKKLRTRLFLVRKQPQKRGESRDIVKKRKLT